jgi:hypothetical protein
MDPNSLDTIGRAARTLLRTKDGALPDFLALPGVADFLQMKLRELPLPAEKLNELAKLVDEDQTTSITAFFKAELPNFLEACVDFYFSRTMVRDALGFQSFPSGSEELTPWAGP